VGRQNTHQLTGGRSKRYRLHGPNTLPENDSFASVDRKDGAFVGTVESLRLPDRWPWADLTAASRRLIKRYAKLDVDWNLIPEDN